MPKTITNASLINAQQYQETRWRKLRTQGNFSFFPKPIRLVSEFFRDWNLRHVIKDCKKFYFAQNLKAHFARVTQNCHRHLKTTFWLFNINQSTRIILNPTQDRLELPGDPRAPLKLCMKNALQFIQVKFKSNDT